jgi:hypothetical protein
MLAVVFVDVPYAKIIDAQGEFGGVVFMVE